MILEKIHPALRYNILPNSAGKDKSEEKQLDEINILNNFFIVPPDYLYIYTVYGKVDFESRDDQDYLLIQFMSPNDSHDLYFELIKGEDRLPGMFPFAGTGGADTLYYGSIEDRLGIYAFSNTTPHISEGVFIASHIFDILINGEGFEALREI